VVESPALNAFDELDEVLLGIVANQAATAIDNARAYQTVEQLGRLKRFFSPQLADLIIRGGADDPLRTHRREVTVVFLDLRGFTAFAEGTDPEEVMGVLHEYHAAMGELILAHEGTLERFTGDGMMIFFNDPVPVPNPAERALRMAVAMRERATELAARWRRRGIRRSEPIVRHSALGPGHLRSCGEGGEYCAAGDEVECQSHHAAARPGAGGGFRDCRGFCSLECNQTRACGSDETSPSDAIRRTSKATWAGIQESPPRAGRMISGLRGHTRSTAHTS
jgi:class 3 adenylate cyclase